MKLDFEKPETAHHWHRWFAWQPVTLRVAPLKIAWLETVERKGYRDTFGVWVWEYRDA